MDSTQIQLRFMKINQLMSKRDVSPIHTMTLHLMAAASGGPINIGIAS